MISRQMRYQWVNTVSMRAKTAHVQELSALNFLCSKTQTPESGWNNLQSIPEKLVHLCHLAGDTEVDCAVADFHDETAADVGLNL